jgi:hypothetical protein
MHTKHGTDDRGRFVIHYGGPNGIQWERGPAADAYFAEVEPQPTTRFNGLTERGRETVRICGFDRATLIDKYNAHVRDTVRPKVEAFRSAAETSDAQQIVRAWSRLLRGLFGDEQPFHALSRDATDLLVSPALRARYQLTL